MLIILMIFIVDFMQVSTYDPPYESVDFRNNQFKFNPGPPRRRVRNKFNFKPPLPSDLSKIYISKKFLPTDKNQTDYLNLPLAISSRLNGEPNVAQTDSGSVPYGEICGKPLSTNLLIFNGSRIPRGAYPWLAAIFGVKPLGLTYLCTASLVSNLHVVTAAHCVLLEEEKKQLRPEDVLVVLGKLNIQKWAPTEGERIMEPSRIHVHPDYDPISSDADIAVLVLSEKITFTRFIRPICLWRGSTDLNEIVGEDGTVVGWGRSENGLLMTAGPKQVKLPIVNQEQCLRSSYQFQYITSNRTFCAGNRNGAGPCNGDSGSGFIMKIGQKWSLRGVTSMAISDSRTCDLSNYVVFTDASKFTTWLLSFVR